MFYYWRAASSSCRRVVLSMLCACLLLLILAPSVASPAKAATIARSTSITNAVSTHHDLPQQPQDDPCMVWGINLCDTLSAVIAPATTAAAIKIAIQWGDWINNLVTSVGSVVYTTPAEMTYQFPSGKGEQQSPVQSIYNDSLWMAEGLLSIAILWAAIRLMTSGVGSWVVYARLVDVLPRVVLGFLAAHFSLEFMTLLIQGNNAICAVYAPTLYNQGNTHVAWLNYGLFKSAAKTNIFIALLFLTYGVLTLCLLLFAYLRLAVIIVLIATAPLWMIMWIAPQTQGVARRCMAAAVVLIFTQAIQVLIMGLSTDMLAVLAQGKPSDVGHVVVTCCIAIAIDAVILLIPKWTVSWINTPADGGMGKVVSAIASLVG